MPTVVRRKANPKSEDRLLDEATNSLLHAIKRHAASQGKKVRREDLKKDGYSERFIAKVEKA